MNIHIIGGGISGLTIAHLLSKYKHFNFKIKLYESNDYLGGKVGMTRYNNYLQEMSPRVFSDNYINFYNLMKEIKIDIKNTSIYDKLTKETHSYIIKKNCNKINIKTIDILKHFNFFDSLKIFYYMVNGLLMSKERLENKYDKISVSSILNDNNTKEMMEYLSYIMGENMDVLPLLKLFKIFEYDVKRFFKEYPNMKTGTRRFTDSLDKVIFNNWEKHLINNGVEINKNHKLIDIKKNINNEIDYLSFEVNNKIKKLYNTDYVIFALNLESLYKFGKKLNLSITNDLKILKQLTLNWQPGLQIYFKDKVEMKIFGSFMLDTDWKLIIQPLDNFYTNSDLTINNNKYKSIWSINIANINLISKRLKKKVLDCNEKEIKNEVIYQINNSCLKNYIYNKINININDIKLWKNTKDRYFWNSLNSYHKRPTVETNINNLLLSGSIIKTNFYSYFVEGAVESGYITTNKLLSKIKIKEIDYYKHERPGFFKLFNIIDKLLYNFDLPSVLNIIIFIFIIIKIYNI